jgi:hypothetical protein
MFPVKSRLRIGGGVQGVVQQRCSGRRMPWIFVPGHFYPVFYADIRFSWVLIVSGSGAVR